MEEDYFIFYHRIYRYRQLSKEEYIFEAYEIGKGWIKEPEYTAQHIMDALHDYGDYSISDASKISKEHAIKITELQEKMQTYKAEGIIYGQGLREYLE